MRSTTLKIDLAQLPSTYPGLGLTFRIQMRNTWGDRLALFLPQTDWLSFTEHRSGKVRKWHNGMFVSACEYAFDIEPFGSREFVFEVRYADSYHDFIDADFDFRRYWIDLPPGIFKVQYRYTVDDNFYDGDTHARVADLIEYASEIQAHAWTGEVVSNQITIDRDNPPNRIG